MTAVDDMAVEVRELLPAPPERVWALLTDVERMAGLGPEHVRAVWLDDERGVGARFRGDNERDGLGAWDVPCTVVASDPPHRFAWTTGSPSAPSGTWSYDLEEADGGTLVVQRFAHGPGFTFVRQAAERRPERAEVYVAKRSAELEANMRSVLQAAAALL